MQSLGLLRHSRSFKVIEFGTNRKLICDFLLVINTNLYDTWLVWWNYVHAFVTSRVDCCNSLLAAVPKYTTDKLQRVLVAATRVITSTRKYDSGLSQLLRLVGCTGVDFVQTLCFLPPVSQQQGATVPDGHLFVGGDCTWSTASSFCRT